jgi:hypothetical protein
MLKFSAQSEQLSPLGLKGLTPVFMLRGQDLWLYSSLMVGFGLIMRAFEFESWLSSVNSDPVMLMTPPKKGYTYTKFTFYWLNGVNKTTELWLIGVNNTAESVNSMMNITFAFV